MNWINDTYCQETAHTLRIPIIEGVHKDGRFYIRKKYLVRAKLTGKKLVIYEKKGDKKEYLATVSEWMKGSKPMDKEFKIKGHPMRLYGNILSKFLYEEKKEISFDLFSTLVKIYETRKSQMSKM